jgi:hypothetical protein
MMDDVAVVGPRLGRAADGEVAEPDAATAGTKGVYYKYPFVV